MAASLVDQGSFAIKVDPVMGRGLYATRLIREGETIFKEEPFVSAQFCWNKAYKYRCCAFCLEPLETAEENVRRLANNPNIILPQNTACETRTAFHVQCENCGEEYCSQLCKDRAWNTWHKTLCPGRSAEDDENHPLNKIVDTWKQIHFPPETTSITLILRFLASLIQDESPEEKIELYFSLQHKFEDANCDAGLKLLGDKFVGEIEMLRQMLANAFTQPIVQPLLTPNGFKRILTLIGQNGQGIGTSPFAVWTRKVSNLQSISDEERQQLDELIDRIYEEIEPVSGGFLDNEGSGLFKFQSLCNHSCVPNAEVSFPFNNHAMVLNATKTIDEGDQIFISYLDECERRRSKAYRMEKLAENYLFECRCTKCSSDTDIYSEPESMDDEDEEDDEDE